ncbi:MAG TPA: hypothetical protein VFU22_29520 [Roseiflexaceae bacterium]|nr:hypothetical protein [Roseiflexaceae bacterium]
MTSVTFTRSSCPQLYLAENKQIGFLLPRDAKADAESLAMASSWASSPAGCYLFLPAPLDAGAHELFAAAAWSYLSDRRRLDARFAWFENPAQAATGLRGSSITLVQGMVDRLVQLEFGGLLLLIQKGCTVDLAPGGDGVRIAPPAGGANALMSASGLRYPIDGAVDLPLAGAAAGCVRFGLTLAHNAIPDHMADLDVGMRIFVRDIAFPASDEQYFLTSLRYPVFSSEKPGDSPGWQRYGEDLTLYATLDPLAHFDGGRTYFSFISPDASASAGALPTDYRTNLGYTIHLTPRDHSSRLVFAPRPIANIASDTSPYYLVPAGEFEISVPRYAAGASRDPGDYDDNLLCGLAGVEYVKLSSERTNVLGFQPGRPAFAPGFTLGASAAGSGEGILTDTATTAWAYVRQVSATTEEQPANAPRHAPIYYAQPDEAVLYQPDPNRPASDETHALLSFLEVASTALPELKEAELRDFPLFPYGGARGDAARGIGLGDYQQIEQQRLLPTRRARIHEIAKRAADYPLPKPRTLGDEDMIIGTTPQGLLAKFADEKQTLFLAKDTANRFLTLANIERGAPLRTALQSSQVFLVISDPDALKRYFAQRRLTIHGWTFDLDPARWKEHGTILIFKFHDKPLEELAADTHMWALPESFNARPSSVSRRLKSIVEEALGRTAEDAVQKDKENYADLARAASDPSWSGIIALNVPIGGIPSSLKALNGGIDRSRFYAQFAGIETTPIIQDQGKLKAGRSSLFGLIDYHDENAPLPSESGYNFQVTLLQVLFQNSQVKAFSSDVSVTLDKLFDEPSQLVGSLSGRNIVVLKGTAEDHDGHTTYAFSFSGDNRFGLPESPVLNEVEVVKAQFATDPPMPSQPNLVVGRFSFWGRMNFRHLAKFDVLSFGADPPPAIAQAADGTDDLPADTQTSALAAPNEQYLSFANLIVTMSFVEEPDESAGTVDESADMPDTPTDPATQQFEPPAQAEDAPPTQAEDTPAQPERAFAFDPRSLTFDTRRSKVRVNSLYAKFPLKLTGMLYSAGDDDKKLNDFGYMPVKTPLGGAKIEGAWYALTFDLELGSLGALAGKAGLVVSIMAAWSPGKPGVFVGLRLPGSSGGKREIAIQGVLKIVFKSIEFVVGDEPGSYLLKLKNIQLKFLVLSLPPSGQTEIIIFGDPKGTAESETKTVAWYAAYAKAPVTQPSQNPGGIFNK